MKLPQGFLQNGLHTQQNIVVPEADHAEPALFENGRTMLIVCRMLDMLAAVQFDNETAFEADKIHHEAPRSRIAAET